MACESELNLKATELRLGLPGSDEPIRTNKRPSQEMSAEDCRSNSNSGDGNNSKDSAPPPAKTQIVGWPPVRSYRKNILQPKKNEAGGAGMYVKVSMDGAPYLRKIDLKVYNNYSELLKALENMFRFTIGGYSEREGYCGSDYMPTYEDKDGDCMLIGDVPWEMFISSCNKLRVVKGSQARGLGSL